ncbi:MAG: hypothetical protein GY706_14790 [Bacteroides sp.]|nr:hypothetical protein [Bacteroides sp.]
MSLEAQIQALSDLGLKLNEGVTIDDLLYSWDRREYESEPFDTILFMFGSEVEREPWGRNVCDRAWNFDVECVEGNGAYVTIVKRLALVAGAADSITDVKDAVSFETGEAWLSYKFNGEPRKYGIKIDNDWADPEVVMAIMKDLERPGYRFYAKDNGQASIWFFLDDATAKKLNELSENALQAN